MRASASSADTCARPPSWHTPNIYEKRAQSPASFVSATYVRSQHSSNSGFLTMSLLSMNL